MVLYPTKIIVLNVITPMPSIIQRILNTYDQNFGLQNFFAKAILTIVFVTTAMIIATVATREDIPWPTRVDFSAISCVIASTSVSPDKREIR